MGSYDDGKVQGEIEESNKGKPKSVIPLHISISQRGLLNIENPQNPPKNSSTPPSTRSKFFDFSNLHSPSLKFQKLAEERDVFSRSVAASRSKIHDLRDRLSGAFARKIDWGSLKKLSKEWIKDPINMALFLWIVLVAISGAILFLVMTGMLNHAIPNKTQRNTWFEVNNQILNALFTLMCLYQHPKRIYHFILLCKWEPKGITRLRKIYCKNGTYKHHEWFHMLVVICLLNLNCFAQYALCGLNLGYKRSNRPAIGVAICISFAIGAPAIAGLYSILSPLGKDYDGEIDEESQVQTELVKPNQRRLEKKYSFAVKNNEIITEENQPQWRGGIFDFWEDISLAYLSLFCSFCVFGWNMERLGFGNMFVHIATFLLFCIAPFFIFNLAALNIDNDMVREALSITGIVLCVFGLLYGGFWRIQMRKRFNLPANNSCCGRPAVSDCALWLCCCWCTLAQEVRTANYYEIVEQKFYRKVIVADDEIPNLPSHDEPNSGRNSPVEKDLSFKGRSASPSRFARECTTPDRQQLGKVEEETSMKGDDETMEPPPPLLIQRDS